MGSSLEDGFEIQERDIAILRGLLESRVMTSRHIAHLFFDGRAEAAKKRLQKLKAAALIGEREGKAATDPSALYLKAKGLLPLKEHGVLAEYPAVDLPVLERRAKVSPLTLAHELEVMDVKTVFHTGARTIAHTSIPEFSTWPALNEFVIPSRERGDVVVKPDGFVRVRQKGADGSEYEHTFFLEVDRSTESLDRLAARASYYLDYYKTGGFAVRNGAAVEAFREYPFRVLAVFKTPERRNNFSERLLQNMPPILTFVWLTTVEEVTSNPFGAIWIRPTDYRDATRGTGYDAAAPLAARGYQRRTAREALIDERVTKRSLFDE
jgi:hypothetical protein